MRSGPSAAHLSGRSRRIYKVSMIKSTVQSRHFASRPIASPDQSDPDQPDCIAMMLRPDREPSPLRCQRCAACPRGDRVAEKVVATARSIAHEGANNIEMSI